MKPTVLAVALLMMPWSYAPPKTSVQDQIDSLRQRVSDLEISVYTLAVCCPQLQECPDK